eukprot:130504-Pleurochrysis_carterae.AAC.1
MALRATCAAPSELSPPRGVTRTCARKYDKTALDEQSISNAFISISARTQFGELVAHSVPMAISHANSNAYLFATLRAVLLLPALARNE